jgi:MFS family permease
MAGGVMETAGTNPQQGEPPRSARNAHWFQFFNAINFQIMMGAPIILYAKSLGATSTVLGVLAAFTPLMTIFQLPAARFLDRIGYKEFILMGWGLRTVFVFLVGLIPLLVFLEPTAKLVLMVAFLFVFNLLRGISSAAWMPWITALIPAPARGRFLSWDQFLMHVGCFVALLVSGLIMSGPVEDWEYAAVFMVAAAGGGASLFFIRRIPGITRGETTKRSAHPVPWRAILGYRPFRALMVFNLAFMVVIGTLGVFTVEFLREIPGFGVDQVIYLSAISFIGAMLFGPLIGQRIDRVGSRPVMAMALLLFAGVVLGWWVLSVGLWPATPWFVALLNFTAGTAGAIFHLANTRLTMLTMPEMGRNHFFALFTVITSLGFGAAPVFWGVTLDSLGTLEVVTGALTWRRHSFYFLIIFIATLATLFLLRRLVEEKNRPTPAPGIPDGRMKRLFAFWFR